MDLRLIAHRLLLPQLLLRRVGLWRSSVKCVGGAELTVGDVVSVEAWKRCVCETYGHTTVRAKSPGTGKQQDALLR